jgi:gliding motility-associated-like protein
MSKDSIIIKVVPTLYIPNCFTPNDDNLNDIFKPEYAGYTDIELLIFDRWGEQIFKTTELHGGWNGKRKDAPCQIGVYTYKLTATDYNKQTIEKIGHVTLLR